MELITIQNLYTKLYEASESVTIIKNGDYSRSGDVLYYINIDGVADYGLYIPVSSILEPIMFYTTFIPDIIRDLKNDDINVIYKGK